MRTAIGVQKLCRLDWNVHSQGRRYFQPIFNILKTFCVYSRRAELAEAKKRAKTYKERKKHDRFDGMPEEEVSKRVLPDHLASNLDIIIVSFSLYFSSHTFHSSGSSSSFFLLSPFSSFFLLSLSLFFSCSLIGYIAIRNYEPRSIARNATNRGNSVISLTRCNRGRIVVNPLPHHPTPSFTPRGFHTHSCTFQIIDIHRPKWKCPRRHKYEYTCMNIGQQLSLELLLFR